MPETRQSRVKCSTLLHNPRKLPCHCDQRTCEHTLHVQTCRQRCQGMVFIKQQKRHRNANVRPEDLNSTAHPLLWGPEPPPKLEAPATTSRAPSPINRRSKRHATQWHRGCNQPATLVLKIAHLQRSKLPTPPAARQRAWRWRCCSLQTSSL